MRHRLVLTYEALADDVTADVILGRLLQSAARPGRRRCRAAEPMSTVPERLLRRLEWRVGKRLDGRLQGAHRTVFRGNGIDFADLRQYVPEDDVRHIDWNVTARLDEPYVRQYTEDREVTAWLVLDRSASMGAGSGRGRRRRRGKSRSAHRTGRRPGRAARRAGQPGRRDAVRPRRWSG